MEVSIFRWCKFSPVLHKILPLAPVLLLSVPRMRMGVYYGFMQPSYLWHFQERRHKNWPRKTAKTFRRFYGDSRTLEEGERYIQHFHIARPCNRFFLIWNLQRGFISFVLFVFLLWSVAVESLFTTSRANESHHPKTPTNPGAIWPNLDGRTSPLWLCRVRSEITWGLWFFFGPKAWWLLFRV